MKTKQPADLSIKSGRAVHFARIGLNLMRTALLWPHYDNKQRKHIENEVQKHAPGSLEFFYNICREPSLQTRKTIFDIVIDKYEKVIVYATKTNPWFMECYRARLMVVS